MQEPKGVVPLEIRTQKRDLLSRFTVTSGPGGFFEPCVPKILEESKREIKIVERLSNRKSDVFAIHWSDRKVFPRDFG